MVVVPASCRDYIPNLLKADTTPKGTLGLVSIVFALRGSTRVAQYT